MKLGQFMFLDIFPKEPVMENGFYKFHLIPVHTISRIWIEQEKVRMALLNLDWFKEQVEKKRIKFPHERRDNEILLTASTADLQKFVVKYANDPKAFAKPGELKTNAIADSCPAITLSSIRPVPNGLLAVISQNCFPRFRLERRRDSETFRGRQANQLTNILRQVIVTLLPLMEYISFSLAASSLYSQESRSVEPRPIVIEVKFGISENGMVTSEWKEAIRNRHDEGRFSVIIGNKKRLSEEEILWAELIKWRVLAWPDRIDSLKIPFKEIASPDTIMILLGNQGGKDAFSHSFSTICFDLGELGNQYGHASTSVNGGRIDRFFAHEFTHLLHKSWLRKHSLKLGTPFEHAL